MESRSTQLHGQLTTLDITAITLNETMIEGSYSKIFIGTLHDQQYAIKKVNDQKYFYSEVNALTTLHQLQTPNIIGLHGSIEDPQYIVLEYLPQGDLYEYLHNKKPFEWQTRFIILEDVATALLFMHAHQFLHRDIKPENVLLTNAMRGKLCDFGFSMSCEAAKKDLVPHGTLALAAPEVLKGYGCTPRSDIYSFGMTIWETMTRKDPFNDYDLDNDDQCTEVMQLKESGHPETIPDYFPKALTYLVEWCWKVNPDERPDTDKVHAVIHGIAKIHQEKINQRIHLRQERLKEQQKSHFIDRKSNSM